MEDLFDQTVETNIVDEQKNYLEELVGDGKKFKSPEELAKGKLYADQHIANLEKTLNELREELKTRKTQEDLIDQIKALKSGEPLVSDTNTKTYDTGTGDENKSGLSIDDVKRILEEERKASIKQTNVSTAINEVTKIYGDNVKAAAAIEQKANELGVTKDYLRNLAQDNPNVFLAMFKAAPAAPVRNDPFSAPASRVNPSAGVTSSGPKYSDFDKLRKTDPNKYFSPAFQRELAVATQRAVESGRYDEFMNS